MTRFWRYLRAILGMYCGKLLGANGRTLLRRLEIVFAASIYGWARLS